MTPDKDAEIARLRRELEYCIAAARENGKERDEALKLAADWQRKWEYEHTGRWNQKGEVEALIANNDQLRAERNELAKSLGAEVATTQRLKAALQRISKGIYGRRQEGDKSGLTDWQIARAALASGVGDGGGK